MSGYWLNPVVFLVDTAFGLYVLAVMLRFLLQLVRAEFYNPICQFIVKLTHPPLRVLRRFIPAIGRVDTAALVLMLALRMLGDYLVFLLQGGGALALGALAGSAVVGLVDLAFNVFIYAVLIQAILSWIHPDPYHPLYALLTDLVDPILRPWRSFIPPLGGVDLSPLVALIALQVLKMLLIPPLKQLALMLAF